MYKNYGVKLVDIFAYLDIFCKAANPAMAVHCYFLKKGLS